MRIDARALLFAVLAGCGIDAVGTLAAPGDGGRGIDMATDAGLTGDAADEGADAASEVDADALAPPPAVFYASTASKLYTYEPLTKKLTFITDISLPCGEMDDLAMNSRGELWGINGVSRELYKFDMTTFACSKAGSPAITQPWGYPLAFVPKETFGTADDVLVSYDHRDYIRIDADGNASTVTPNALDLGQTPSGDLTMMGSRMFASITGSTSCDTDDCLFELDPKTGMLVKDWGHFPGTQIYAIAQWAGKLYGFQSNGTIYETTLAAPLAFVTTAPDGGIPFYGAASSPRAPTQ